MVRTNGQGWGRNEEEEGRGKGSQWRLVSYQGTTFFLYVYSYHNTKGGQTHTVPHPVAVYFITGFDHLGLCKLPDYQLIPAEYQPDS